MKKHFRIHGDNIIECERIAKILLGQLEPLSEDVHLSSPSTISIKATFTKKGRPFEWNIDLLPGFNKAGRTRWQRDIFDILKRNGSFLDETPDAIVTEIKNDKEQILFAIEFCSALQAGNQAWQRSGRAYSTGITGCPYIYIVDFVKYELDSKTRERKALRFPNAAIPYSYISFSKNNNLKVVQAYFKAEEFDKKDNEKLKDFDENNFAEKDFANFVVNTMLEERSDEDWEALTQKNFKVVRFLAKANSSNNSLTDRQWEKIHNDGINILDFSKTCVRMGFEKKVAQKSKHGNLDKFFTLVKNTSIGIASKDLPFGAIPAAKRSEFSEKLKRIYPEYDDAIIRKISKNDKDLLICLLKGFKPKGDDNRPDRGALPFAQMLVGQNCDVMTFLYGPLLRRNLTLLQNNPKQLAKNNGLWNALISLSDFIAIDMEILEDNKEETGAVVKYLKDVHEFNHRTISNASTSNLYGDNFSSMPQSYHEDDVDTAIHYLFSRLLCNSCFEGMCNPPGGDWSGFSVIDGSHEKRWLSLPRVSDEIAGKRPDHIIELFGIFDKPALLSIESKENSKDLEENVGKKLVEYIKRMMDFIPNVKRDNPKQDWEKCNDKSSFKDFIVISAAAYLSDTAQMDNVVFEGSKCDMLFKLKPISNAQRNGWNIVITWRTENAKILKSFLEKTLKGQGEIVIS